MKPDPPFPPFPPWLNASIPAAFADVVLIGASTIILMPKEFPPGAPDSPVSPFPPPPPMLSAATAGAPLLLTAPCVVITTAPPVPPLWA